jgi:lysophospholipase L1-like esterase
MAASMSGPRPRARVVVLFVLILAATLAAVLEGGARLWSLVRERREQRRDFSRSGPPLAPAQVEAASRALGLDPYESADPVRPGRWRPRAGYRGTFGEVLEAKRAAGHVLAVRHMEDASRALGIAREQLAVEVNAEGYRGPALDPRHSAPRILALGDSCTFGTPVAEEYTYARALERELRARGHRVEVVNGGVEGYDPSDVLARLDEFRALRPDITTLYIGWNSLYRDRYLEEASGLARYLDSVRLLLRVRDVLASRRANPQRAALELYERPKHPVREAPEVALALGYAPSFLWQVERIVAGMREAGSRVVILTLPGLYSLDRQPSARALAVGHLPAFTDNPFVLAAVAARYNEALRELASRQGLTMVDLERWAHDTLQPPESHFVDSVHLDERAQRDAGTWLAGALGPLVGELERRAPAAQALGAPEASPRRIPEIRSSRASLSRPASRPRGE